MIEISIICFGFLCFSSLESYTSGYTEAIMSKKDVEVKSIEKFNKEMVTTDSIKKLIETFDYEKNDAFSLVNKLKLLINYKEIKDMKYAGLTEDDWEKLNKLSYVTIELYEILGDGTVFFLEEFINMSGKLEEIKSLEPDPINMERTSKNIPHGIEVEYTVSTGHKIKTVTPSYICGNWSHYRILGVKAYD